MTSTIKIRFTEAQIALVLRAQDRELMFHCPVIGLPVRNERGRVGLSRQTNVFGAEV
jgi:hypothetical protein